MIINFKKNISANYLVINDVSDFDENSFSVNMLKKNSIKNLLKFDYETINGQTNFLYNISSKQSFEKIFEFKKLSFQALFDLTSAFVQAICALNDHLLNPEGLIVKKEYIFLDSSDQIFFCYCPDHNDSFLHDFSELCDELLYMIDYTDRDAVDLVYNVNRVVKSDGFTVNDLKEILKDYDTVAAKKPDNFSEPLPDFSDEPSQKPTWNNSLDKSYDFSEPSFFKEEPRHAVSFFKKTQAYLKGKTLINVLDDINSWTIFKKIKAASTDLINETGSFCEPSDLYETVPHSDYKVMEKSKQSYINEAPIESCEDNPTTVLQEGGSHRQLNGLGNAASYRFSLPKFPVTIGSSSKNTDLQISVPTISRIHCRICKNEDESESYTLEDMNSTNGTFVNGTPLAPYTKTELHVGDLVQLAELEFNFI